MPREHATFWLSVPAGHEKRVQQMGAEFDKAAKRWYVPPHVSRGRFGAYYDYGAALSRPAPRDPLPDGLSEQALEKISDIIHAGAGKTGEFRWKDVHPTQFARMADAVLQSTK